MQRNQPRPTEVLRPPTRKGEQAKPAAEFSSEESRKLSAWIIEAANQPESQRITSYEKIADTVDLPDLFSVPVGTRQRIVDLLAQDDTARFAFRLSERSEKMIQKWIADKAVTNWPDDVAWDEKDQPCGFEFENGSERGKSRTRFVAGKTVEVGARQAIFLWARYGDSVADGKPVGRLPSLRGLIEYVERR